MDYVIIGNSAAAIGAVEAIRSQDKQNKIILISDEPYLTYSRPLISYWLAGKVSDEDMFFRGENFYQRNDVEAILGKKAVELNPSEKEILLADGEKIFYHKLLIASGGSPIIPQIEGQNAEGVFTFTKWDDARRVRQFTDENQLKQAVVIGGGLIGLKATEALIELGIKVSIIELADRILSATFDKKASEIIENRLQEIGCALITENTVAEIEQNGGKVSGVILRDRNKIPCQMVILAIGVNPNVALAKGTGIQINRGILVNQRMETNIPDIYAAGDVVEAYDLVMGENRSIAIWPNAFRQGSIAGYNMVGMVKEYSGSFAMNSVEICDIPTISVGLTEPAEDDYETLQYCDEQKPIYKKIVLKDGVIVGAIFIGDIERAGIITGLLKDKIDTTSFKERLLREDFGLISLPKDYRKHLVTGVGIEV